MEKQKCYISGKISDLEESVAFDHFENAEAKVIALGYEPVNPMKLPHNHDKSYDSYIKEDLHAMIDCKAIFFLRNYVYSNGALNIELPFARILNLNFYFEV